MAKKTYRVWDTILLQWDEISAMVLPTLSIAGNAIDTIKTSIISRESEEYPGRQIGIGSLFANTSSFVRSPGAGRHLNFTAGVDDDVDGVLGLGDDYDGSDLILQIYWQVPTGETMTDKSVDLTLDCKFVTPGDLTTAVTTAVNTNIDMTGKVGDTVYGPVEIVISGKNGAKFIKGRLKMKGSTQSFLGDFNIEAV